MALLLLALVTSIGNAIKPESLFCKLRALPSELNEPTCTKNCGSGATTGAAAAIVVLLSSSALLTTSSLILAVPVLSIPSLAAAPLDTSKIRLE